ncbi:MAG: CSLREA domain-containing protein, partial [Anaerolineae bacterium]|nr:CSLREA domain-containing protein [Anaerolineae bacterium]
MPALKLRLAYLLLLCGFCVFFLNFFIPQFTAYAASIEVNTLDDEYGNNASQCALREAITAANTDAAYGGCPAGSGDDTITFSVTGDLVISSSLPAVTAPLTIDGPPAPVLRVGAASSGSVQPSLLEIQSNVTVTINNIWFQNGYSNRGGAIYNRGTLILNSASARNNTAGIEGGAIYNAANAFLTISGGVYEHNQAMDGGGVFNDGALIVNGASFTGNTAGGGTGGGAIYNFGTASISNAAFSQNIADLGGALAMGGGDITIENSTFSGNLSYGDGGALIGLHGMFNLYNVTLAGNHASSSGGAIRTNSTASAFLYNTLIASNSASSSGANCSYGGTFVDGGYNLATDSTCGFSAGNGSLVVANAMLGYFGSWGGSTNTINLEAGSPALDAGSNALVPSSITTDQRGSGYARIVGGTVDIGAFEEQTTSATATFTPTPTDTPSPTPTDTPSPTPTDT